VRIVSEAYISIQSIVAYIYLEQKYIILITWFSDISISFCYQ